MNKQTVSTDEFRCLAYEPIFQQIYKSYTGQRHYNEIAAYGGGAGGKSEHVAREIEFWQPENAGDEALVLTYSPSHSANTLIRFTRVLDQHGMTYNVKGTDAGKILSYGNNNHIHFISVKAASFEETQEKLKTFVTIKPKSLKFVWFEEFTAIMHLFKSYETFIFSASRIFREMRDDSIVFYLWNPPKNSKHPIYDFLKNFGGLEVFTTIYDLPVKWQSKQDIRIADGLKKSNPTAYRLTYLGEAVGSDGLAYVIDESIFTPLANDYMHFHYLTDEGTANATTFMLIGVTAFGEVHCISSYYHSSKEDGVRKSPSEYAKEFQAFEQMHGVSPESITTDGIYFAAELGVHGYPEAQSIHRIKNRPLSYQLSYDLMAAGNFKIVVHEDEYGEYSGINRANNLLYRQLENAQLEETMDSKGKRVYRVDKTPESKSDNQAEHLHLVDLLLYFCTRHQKNIIGGSWKDN